jgi:hypothetical protein
MNRRVVDYQAPPPNQAPRNKPGAADRLPWLQPFLNWKVLLGAVAVAASLLLCSALVLMIGRAAAPNQAPATAVLQIIAAPTATATLAGGEPAAGATGTVIPTPPPGVLAMGAYVQVVGTGGSGLRMREEPSLNGKVLTLGGESEVFRIEDGPKEQDGYTWWYLVGPFDANRKGWAVVNYLQVVQNP